MEPLNYIIKFTMSEINAASFGKKIRRNSHQKERKKKNE